jgi:hypothetical protein
MDINQLLWITIPLTLLIIAILQILYLLWINYAPTSTRTPKSPDSPIMPTVPQGGFATRPPSYGPSTSLNPRTSIGKMIVIAGLNNVTEIALPSFNFGIGRFHNPDQNVAVALDEKSISRRHAQFTGDEMLREYFLTDMGSTYGTMIRKEGQFQMLTPQQRERIYNEDVVMFGNAVTVRFILPGDTRASATRL